MIAVVLFDHFVRQNEFGMLMFPDHTLYEVDNGRQRQTRSLCARVLLN